MIETKDLFWLAGLLEGEGCFTVSDKYPRIVLTMCDLDVMERANRLLRPFSDSLKNKPKRVQRQAETFRHPIYVISLSGARAAGWMMTLYDLMGHRRQARIREALQTWRSAPSGRGMYQLKRYAPELLPKKEEPAAIN